jgi:hypothetical protein
MWQRAPTSPAACLAGFKSCVASQACKQAANCILSNTATSTLLHLPVCYLKLYLCWLHVQGSQG